MKKLSIILMLLTWITINSIAQDKVEKTTSIFTKENAFIGGNVTVPILSILQGQNNIMISANPHFGYIVSKNVDVAAVLNLQKNKYEISENSILNLINNQSTAKVSMIGLGVFSRVYILDVAFLQVQPELNYVTLTETKYIINGVSLPVSNTSKTSNIKPSFLIGAGYKRGFNKGNTFFYASIMYDLISKNSPYSNGIATALNNNQSTPVFFRAGVNFMLKDLKRK